MKKGRPTISDEDYQAMVFQVRLTLGEAELIDVAASDAKLTRSQWCRKALLYAAQNGMTFSRFK